MVFEEICVCLRLVTTAGGMGMTVVNEVHRCFLQIFTILSRNEGGDSNHFYIICSSDPGSSDY